METQKSIEFLRHEFSDEELISRSKLLAQKLDEKGQLTSQFDGIKADFKGKEKVLDAFIAQYQREVANGWEMRSTEIEVSFDYETGTVTTVRLDTGEVVTERNMTHDERQMEIA